MSGTHVYYNGVLLRDCETIEHQSLIEYDESNTHARFIRTRITVASTLISVYSPGVSTPQLPAAQHSSTIQIPPITDETMVGRFEEILQLLSEPRKDFWYAVNAVNDTPPAEVNGVQIPKEVNVASYRLVLVATGIIPKPPVVSEDPEAPPPPPPTDRYVQLFGNNLTVERVNVLDANAGPKPMGIDVREVMGGQLMRVQATFEICRVLSKPVDDIADPVYDAQRARGIISNTWSCIDSMDDDGNVQHVIKGEIRLKDQRYKPNAMRMFAFPLAFPYARVVDRQYSTDESGLLLRYEFTMKHAGAAPPPGVRKFEADYVESVRIGQKGPCTARMNITVWGWQHRSLDGDIAINDREKTQKRLLLRGIHTILWSRIRGINKNWLPDPIPGATGTTTQLVSCDVFEKVGHPKLTMSVVVSYTDEDQSEFANRVRNMGNSFFIDVNGPAPQGFQPYDPRWWPIDNEWGRLLNEDAANPNFRNAAYPYASKGEPNKSDYFTGYYHSAGSQRHTLPRLTGRTVNGDDASSEWAKPGGYTPSTAVPPAEDTEATAVVHPVTFNATLLTPSVNLNGYIVMGPLPPVEDASNTGVTDVQSTAFCYVQWNSEIKSDTNQGMVALPLSQPRDIPQAKLASYGAGFYQGKECSVTVRLHAPLTQRIVSGTATRNNTSPQIPDPLKQFLHYEGSGTTKVITNVETLMSKEIVMENPVLLADKCTRQYTLSFRYVYSLSNPWAGDASEGESVDLPWGIDPTIKADSRGNRITVRGGTNNFSPLFYETQTIYG